MAVPPLTGISGFSYGNSGKKRSSIPSITFSTKKKEKTKKRDNVVYADNDYVVLAKNREKAIKSPTSVGITKSDTGKLSTQVNYSDPELLNKLIQNKLVDEGLLDNNQLKQLQRQGPGILERIGRLGMTFSPVEYFFTGPVKGIEDILNTYSEVKEDKKITPMEGLKLAGRTAFEVATKTPVLPFIGINPLAIGRKLGTGLYDTFISNDEESIQSRQYGALQDRLDSVLDTASQYYEANGKPDEAKGLQNVKEWLGNKELGRLNLPIIGETAITPRGLIGVGDFAANVGMKAPFGMVDLLKKTFLVKGNLFNKTSSIAQNMSKVSNAETEIERLARAVPGRAESEFAKLAEELTDYLTQRGDDVSAIISNTTSNEERYKALLDRLVEVRTPTEESLKNIINKNYDQFVSEGEDAASVIARQKSIYDKVVNAWRNKKDIYKAFSPPTIDLSDEGEALLEALKRNYKDITSITSKKRTPVNVLRELINEPSSRMVEEVLHNPQFIYDNVADYSDDVLATLGRVDDVANRSRIEKLMRPVRAIQAEISDNFNTNFLSRILEKKYGKIDLKALAPAERRGLVDFISDRTIHRNLSAEVMEKFKTKELSKEAQSLAKNNKLIKSVYDYITRGEGSNEYIDALIERFRKVDGIIINKQQARKALDALSPNDILLELMELHSLMPNTLAQFKALKKFYKKYDTLINNPKTGLLKMLFDEGAGIPEDKLIPDYVSHFFEGEEPSGFKMDLSRNFGPTIGSAKAGLKGESLGFVSDLPRAIEYTINTRLDRLAKTKAVRRALQLYADPASIINNPAMHTFTESAKSRMNNRYANRMLEAIETLLNTNYPVSVRKLKEIINENPHLKSLLKSETYDDLSNARGQIKFNLAIRPSEVDINHVTELRTALMKEFGDPFKNALWGISGITDEMLETDMVDAVISHLRKQRGTDQFDSLTAKYEAIRNLLTFKEKKLPKVFGNKNLGEVLELNEKAMNEVDDINEILTKVGIAYGKGKKTSIRAIENLKRAYKVLGGLDDENIPGALFKNKVGRNVFDEKELKRLAKIFIGEQDGDNLALVAKWVSGLPSRIASKDPVKYTREEIIARNITNKFRKLTTQADEVSRGTAPYASDQVVADFEKFLRSSDENVRELIASMYITNPVIDKKSFVDTLKEDGVSGLSKFFGTGKEQFRPSMIKLENMNAEALEQGVEAMIQTGKVNKTMGEALKGWLARSGASPKTKSTAIEILGKIGNLQKQYLVATFGTQFGNVFSNNIMEILNGMGVGEKVGNFNSNAKILRLLTEDLISKSKAVGLSTADKLEDLPKTAKAYLALNNKIGRLNPSLLSRESLTRAEMDVMDVVSKSRSFQDATLMSQYSADVGEILVNSSNTYGDKIKNALQKANIFVNAKEGGLIGKAKGVGSEISGINMIGQLADYNHKINMARVFLQKTGGNVDEARRLFDEFFITFSSLTPLEQMISRRIVLFWSWFRSNFFNNIRGFVKDPEYAKRVGNLYRVIDMLRSEELEEKQKGLPNNSYFRNVFFIGTPDQYISSLRTPIEAFSDFSRNIPFLAGNRLVDSISNIAGNSQIPIQLAVSLFANRDPRTGEVINPLNDPNIRADVEGYTRASKEWGWLENMPESVQKAFNFAVVENPITKQKEYRIDPYINYTSKQAIAPARLMQQLYRLGATVPDAASDPSIFGTELMATITGMRVKGANDLLRITRAEELNKKSDMQKLLNEYGVLSSRQEMFGTPLQLEKAGLPRTADTKKKAEAFESSPLNYYEYQRQQKIKKEYERQQKKADKKAKKRLKSASQLNQMLRKQTLKSEIKF